MKIYFMIIMAWWLLAMGASLAKDGEPIEGNTVSFVNVLIRTLILAPIFYWAYCWVSQ